MNQLRLLSSLCLSGALLGSLACVQAPSGGTANTSLYVFDNATASVMVWTDVNTVYAAPSAPPAANYTLTAGAISNRAPLAWGGMAVDPTHNCLYLVAAAGGAVTCITQLTTQTGAVTQASDITTFNLGQSTDDYPSGSFGEAFVDPTSNTLYVTETTSDRTASRIWVVPNASVTQGLTVPVTSVIPSISNDMGSSGVAVGENAMVYAYFPNGNTLYSNLLQNDPLDGARIRQGSNTAYYSSLITTDVLVGPLTELSDSTTTYGTLAYDTVNNLLYCSRQANSAPVAPATALPAVLVFTPGQFTTSNFNVAPSTSTVLTDTATTLPDLRFISHAGIKDWLAGADVVSGAGTNAFHLWKAPSTGGLSTLVTLPAGVQVAGIALDGSN